MPPAEGTELYRLPLGEFTKARDELARRLRKEGRRAEADAVKALRKPTVAAWAVNQLAHRRRDEVKQLLDAGRRLREAQGTLLSGGDRNALKRAAAEERRLVDQLTRDASVIADEARTAAGGNLAERIRSTLRAAALDEDTAAELGEGRLVREREAVGLFGTAPPASQRPRATTQPAPAKRTGAGRQAAPSEQLRREAARAVAAARAAEQKARRDQARAAQAAERAETRMRDAQARADESRRRAEDARAALREARRKERDAAKAAERAARGVAAAERKLG